MTTAEENRTPHLIERAEKAIALLPELKREGFTAICEVFAIWVQIKAEYEHRWTEEQRQCLRQLDPDAWHSSLLHRMMLERKPPVPDPPRLEHSYPVYPDG